MSHSLPQKLLTPWAAVVLAALAGLGLPSVQAQERIYRCGNEYMNNAQAAKSRGCVLVEGGNVTIVQGTLPQRSSAADAAPRPAQTAAAGAARTSGERVDASAQRARDSDAKAILEGELRQAQERLAQAQKNYANGEPEKQGIEGRNHQRYLDRVEELKAGVARAQGDVDSLRRELNRFSPGAAASNAQ